MINKVHHINNNNNNNNNNLLTRPCVERNSEVGVETRYGLDGPGIESRRGEISSPIQIGPGAHLASCTTGTRFFPGVKRPGRGADHPPPSSGEVKERVEPYLYSSVRALMACSRVNVTFLFTRQYVDGTVMSKRVALS
jgi:hypothetical protein